MDGRSVSDLAEACQDGRKAFRSHPPGVSHSEAAAALGSCMLAMHGLSEAYSQCFLQPRNEVLKMVHDQTVETIHSVPSGVPRDEVLMARNWLRINVPVYDRVRLCRRLQLGEVTPKFKASCLHQTRLIILSASAATHRLDALPFQIEMASSVRRKTSQGATICLGFIAD